MVKEYSNWTPSGTPASAMYETIFIQGLHCIDINVTGISLNRFSLIVGSSNLKHSCRTAKHFTLVIRRKMSGPISSVSKSELISSWFD
ncbi:hypothetical protein NPIL_225271 [Nephila pilipes]|uniref:Uncharacterized protein n=1 Tax=Nephila pilipes TaxID=299642 RepID=A0A8X6R616_NEPPI|nr:hypothetical protein NPIL_225271 [Nephila pilipes]